MIYFAEGVGSQVPRHAVPVGIAVFAGLFIAERLFLPYAWNNFYLNAYLTSADGSSMSLDLQTSGAGLDSSAADYAALYVKAMTAYMVIAVILKAVLYFLERYLLEKHYNAR
jgi:ABC-type glycerol-3-phosphate transport system permease component